MKSLYEEALAVYNTQPLDSAKKVAADYLKIAKKGDDRFYQLKAYFLLAYICSHTEQFGDAVIYYLEAGRIGEELGGMRREKNLYRFIKIWLIFWEIISTMNWHISLLMRVFN